jgi:hypothetical protein
VVYGKSLAMRGGYEKSDAFSGLVLGLGWRGMGFGLDYAYRPRVDLGQMHYLTLSLLL